MSYLTQMVALVGQQFASAAAGMCVMVGMIRGFSRKDSPTIGNFWVDVIRGIYYILLPIAAVAAVIYIGQGAVQTLAGPAHIHDAAERRQADCIPRGPQGSMTPIKQLGNNGGGYTNANGAHPFENPTAFTQWLSLVAAPVDPGREHLHVRQDGQEHPPGRRGSLRRWPSSSSPGPPSRSTPSPAATPPSPRPG